jgi:chromosome partitioning protein
MKTLVTANQKGGVGKTSTLVHLAFDFVERGLKVVVIDLDTQANASYTLQQFKVGWLASDLFNGNAARSRFSKLEGNPVLIESGALLADLERKALSEVAPIFKSNLDALKECGFDVCLIDTAPSLGNGLAAALFASDYVLSPIELEVYSIQGIKLMITAISNMRKANPGLRFLGMVPSKVDSRNPRHSEHLKMLNKTYKDLMIPTVIGLRSSIADALSSGVPVWKIKKTAARKAAKEVRAMASYVYDMMEIKK